MYGAKTNGQGQVTETVGPSVVRTQKSSDSPKERGRERGQPIVACFFHQHCKAAYTQKQSVDFHYFIHSTNTVNKMNNFLKLNVMTLYFKQSGVYVLSLPYSCSHSLSST